MQVVFDGTPNQLSSIKVLFYINWLQDERCYVIIPIRYVCGVRNLIHAKLWSMCRSYGGIAVFICEIWSSHDGDCEKYIIVGCSTVLSNSYFLLACLLAGLTLRASEWRKYVPLKRQ
jgi:hypothetical protein